MLISDKHQFIIATPTKCGTTSLVAMTNHYLRHGGDPDVLRVVHGLPMTKHRMAPPPGCGLYQRWLVTRRGRDRLVSMYEWLRRKPTDELFGRKILRAEADGDRRDGWRYMLQMFGDVQAKDTYADLCRRSWGGARPFLWVDSCEVLRQVMRGRLWSQDAPWFHHGVGVNVVGIERLDPVKFLYDLGVRDDRLLMAEVKRLNHTQESRRLFPDVESYFAVSGVDGLLRRIDWAL